MDISECDHEFIKDGDKNICINCDVIMADQLEQGYESKNYTTGGSSSTSVLDNVLGVPEEVKNLARTNIYRKGEFFTKKVRNDPKNTFAELYIAYRTLNIPFDPDELGRNLKLKRKSLHHCLKQVSGTLLVPSPHDDGQVYVPVVMIHPANLIEKRCADNDIEEKYIPEIKKKTKKILEKKPILIQTPPNQVACAVIKCFMEENGISTKGFAKFNNLSDNALKQCVRDIEEFFDIY